MQRRRIAVPAAAVAARRAAVAFTLPSMAGTIRPSDAAQVRRRSTSPRSCSRRCGATSASTPTRHAPACSARSGPARSRPTLAARPAATSPAPGWPGRHHAEGRGDRPRRIGRRAEAAWSSAASRHLDTGEGAARRRPGRCRRPHRLVRRRRPPTRWSWWPSRGDTAEAWELRRGGRRWTPDAAIARPASGPSRCSTCAARTRTSSTGDAALLDRLLGGGRLRHRRALRAVVGHRVTAG